jgi:Zn-finger nucleic acid-binding protein
MMTERSGVEIDYCPKCRGIWLDKGELDKIIERSLPFDNSADNSSYDQGKHKNNEHGHHDSRYSRKRRGFLGNLFDFD